MLILEPHKEFKRVTRVQCSLIFTFMTFGNLREEYPFFTKWLPRNHHAVVLTPEFCISMSKKKKSSIKQGENRPKDCRTATAQWEFRPSYNRRNEPRSACLYVHRSVSAVYRFCYKLNITVCTMLSRSSMMILSFKVKNTDTVKRQKMEKESSKEYLVFFLWRKGNKLSFEEPSPRLSTY